MKYLTVALLILFVAVPVSAQVDFEGPSLYLAVSPQYPKPNESVTFTVQSPILDLATRTITWKNNGAVALEGEGETVYRVAAPAAGGRMDIMVAVEGVATPAAVSVSPSTVDLMWESDSFVPGLYRGRHLPSLGSTITLQALPHILKNGSEVPASQLVFSWSQNGRTLQSGKGKFSITVPVAEFVESSSITVNVTTPDKTAGATKSVSIATAQPGVRLYVEHPLYGTMYHQALPAVSGTSDIERSFAAIPYFAQASGPNDKLFSYIWRVNRAPVDANDERPNTLTINAGAAGGTARIELSLTHKKNFQLDARGSWDVTFGSVTQDGGTDLFTGQ